MSDRPHFGFTRHGKAVHAATADYHNAGGFNKAIAQALTRYVGSMACFWVFNLLALLSLPATLHLMGVVGTHWLGIPSFFLTYGWIFLIAWICQNFIQLVLLPAIMVGQSLQTAAADARAAKQFEDLEQVRDWLDLGTKGGITTILGAIKGVDDRVDEVHRHVTALAPKAGLFPPPADAQPAVAPQPVPPAPPASRKLQRPGGDRM